MNLTSINRLQDSKHGGDSRIFENWETLFNTGNVEHPAYL